MVKAHRLEERAQAKDTDAKALHLARVRIDDFSAERASLAAGVQQAWAELDTLANLICKLEVAVTTHHGEFRVVLRAVKSLKELVTAGRTRAITAEGRARETLDKMSDLHSLVELLTGIIEEESGGVAGCRRG